jgi:hypothetical protein
MDYFNLKYFNFKDYTKYKLQKFLKYSSIVPDDGVVEETCCTYMR